MNWISELWRLVVSRWRTIVGGVLLGATAAILLPSVWAGVRRLWSTVEQPVLDAVVVPRHAVIFVSIFMLASLALLSAVTIRGVRRVWESWRAGLATGLGVVWCACTTIALVTFETEFSPYALAFLVLAVLITAVMATVQSRSAVLLVETRTAATDPDRAIDDWDQDILDRRFTVDALIQRIVDDKASVVALVGPFGDGKTSVLNLLKKTLEKVDDVAVVPFSSWLPGNEQVLVASFFNSVVRTLEKQYVLPAVKRQFIRYARLLTSSLPKVGTTVRELFGEPSLAEQLRELRLMVERLPVRVVVLVDDVDRMNKPELDVLLKLIRSASDFSNLTYVCAFHKESLSKHYEGATDHATASEYLDKFFPVQVQLPKIDEAILAEEFNKRFEELCKRHGFLGKRDEQDDFNKRFQPLWKEHVQKNLRNLRRLKLFFNRIESCIGPVAREINLLDFLVLELVREAEPQVYEQVYRNGPCFYYPKWEMETWGEILVDDNRAANERKNFFESLFSELERDQKDFVVRLLGEAFPVVTEWKEGKGLLTMRAPDSEESAKQRRIHHPRFFRQYFIQRVPSGQFGEVEFQDFVSRTNEGKDVEDCTKLFKVQFSSLTDTTRRRWQFLDRLARSTDLLHRTPAIGVAIGVAELSGELEPSLLGLAESDRAAAIVLSVANRLAESGDAQSFLETIIARAQSDEFAAEILGYSAEGKGQQILTQRENIDPTKLRLCFRDRMKTKYFPGSTISVFESKESYPLRAFFAWVRSAADGEKEVRDYFSYEFEKRPQTIGRFLLWILPSDDRAGPDALAGLNKLFPIEKLRELIKEVGEKAYADEQEQLAVERFVRLTTLSSASADR